MSPVNHTESCLANRRPIAINGNLIRNGFRPSAIGVHINERPDLPFFAEVVGWIIVMGRVKAEVEDFEIRVDAPEFVQSNNAGDTVMSASINKADMQRQISGVLVIVKGKHIQRVAKEVAFQITVPAPSGVRVREMPVTGAVAHPRLVAITDFMTIGVRVCMDSSAIARDSDAVRGNKSKFHRRHDGSNGEKLLKEFFVVEREVLAVKSALSQDFGNAGMAVGELFIGPRFRSGFSVFVMRE